MEVVGELEVGLLVFDGCMSIEEANFAMASWKMDDVLKHNKNNNVHLFHRATIKYRGL